MRFIWNEPEKHPDPLHNYPKNLYWTDAIDGWLKSQGVWLGKLEYNVPVWEMSYNYCYHFYDIRIFDQSNNGHPRDDMRRYLQETNLDWTETDTFRWSLATEERKQIQGSRFWIQAEDFPNKTRFSDLKIKRLTDSAFERIEQSKRIKDEYH